MAEHGHGHGEAAHKGPEKSHGGGKHFAWLEKTMKDIGTAGAIGVFGLLALPTLAVSAVTVLSALFPPYMLAAAGGVGIGMLIQKMKSSKEKKGKAAGGGGHH